MHGVPRCKSGARGVQCTGYPDTGLARGACNAQVPRTQGVCNARGTPTTRGMKRTGYLDARSRTRAVRHTGCTPLARGPCEARRTPTRVSHEGRALHGSPCSPGCCQPAAFPSGWWGGGREGLGGVPADPPIPFPPPPKSSQGGGHRTLLYGHAILLRHSHSGMVSCGGRGAKGGVGGARRLGTPITGCPSSPPPVPELPHHLPLRH